MLAWLAQTLHSPAAGGRPPTAACSSSSACDNAPALADTAASCDKAGAEEGAGVEADVEAMLEAVAVRWDGWPSPAAGGVLLPDASSSSSTTRRAQAIASDACSDKWACE